MTDFMALAVPLQVTVIVLADAPVQQQVLTECDKDDTTCPLI